MKKQHFLVALAAFLFISLNGMRAQTISTEDSPLAGIWQMYVSTDQTVVPIQTFIPFFKILGKDGSFSNLMAGTVGSYLSQQGTYEITSDSTYVEKIKNSTISMHNGSDSFIKYRLENNNNVLRIQWSLVPDRWTEETWIRVK